MRTTVDRAQRLLAVAPPGHLHRHAARAAA
jgi:hypothetical protein